MRNKMGVGFVIMAGFLAVASVSFACTAFLGNMTFTTPNGSQTVTGIGNGDPGIDGMDWCGGEPTWALTATVASNPQSLGISSGVATGCTTSGVNSFLPNGTYNIAWNAYQPSTPTPGQHTNCHSETTNVFGIYTVTGGAGQGAITSGGTWSPTPATTGQQSLRGYANVCVYMIPVTDSRAPANAINIVLI